MTDRPTDAITLRGLRFSGRHGVGEAERSEPQPFEVDLAVRLDLRPAAASDDLADTVDYPSLYEIARAVVEDESHRLMEAMADAIAAAVLARHPAVVEVEVRVRKVEAPLPGPFDAVEVSLRRSR